MDIFVIIMLGSMVKPYRYSIFVGYLEQIQLR